MHEIYILGAGGLGKEMAWHLEMLDIQSKGYRLVGFLDDDQTKWNRRVYGYAVLGRLEEILRPGEFVLLGIGDPQVRSLGAKRIKAKGGIPYTLVSPDVIRAKNTTCGAGAVLELGALLGPDSRIGDGVLVNKRVMVTHDVDVGDYSVLSPHVFLSGGSKVGVGCSLGVGATVLPGVSVSKGCVIGAGAVVTRDLPAFSLAVGVPAVVKKHVAEWPIEGARSALA
jgi:sugar O-acyltransferase (sialic acid O-acetyltransferase NeuD family)